MQFNGLKNRSTTKGTKLASQARHKLVTPNKPFAIANCGHERRKLGDGAVFPRITRMITNSIPAGAFETTRRQDAGAPGNTVRRKTGKRRTADGPAVRPPPYADGAAHHPPPHME